MFNSLRDKILLGSFLANVGLTVLCLHFFFNRQVEEKTVIKEKIVTDIVETPARVIYKDRPVPVFSFKRDTMYLKVTATDTLIVRDSIEINNYKEIINDSLLTGTLYMTTEGILKNWTLDYVTKNTNTFRTIETTRIISPRRLLLNSSFYPDSRIIADFGVSLQFRKGYVLGVAYDIENKNYKITTSFPLQLK